MRIATKRKFAFVKTVFEKFIVMSEDFSPNLQNVTVRNFDEMPSFIVADDNRITTVAGHVGEAHFVVRRNEEDAMTRGERRLAAVYL